MLHFRQKKISVLKQSLVSACALLVGAAVVAPAHAQTPTPTATATPAAVTLDYSISTKGNFLATLTFASTPSKKCDITVGARLSNLQGAGQGSGKTSTLAKRSSKAKTIKLRANRLPPVKSVSTSLTGTDAKAILSVQAKVKCGSEISYSNVVAHYLDCGNTKLKSVSASALVKLLKAKLVQK